MQRVGGGRTGSAQSGRNAPAVEAVAEQDACRSEEDVASSCSAAGDPLGLQSDLDREADAAHEIGGAWEAAGEESGVTGASGEFHQSSDAQRAEIAGLLDGGGFGDAWVPPDQAATLLDREGLESSGHGGFLEGQWDGQEGGVSEGGGGEAGQGEEQWGEHRSTEPWEGNT